MMLATTHVLEGYRVLDYHGVVVGEAILGSNLIRDVLAQLKDMLGGRSGAYESILQRARETAMSDLALRARSTGGNAVIGVDLDYAVIGHSMLMVSVAGTAVTVEKL